jgi:hypothetical protein
MGEWNYIWLPILASAIYGGEWSLFYALVVLTPKKGTHIPSGHEAQWLHSWSWCCREGRNPCPCQWSQSPLIGPQPSQSWLSYFRYLYNVIHYRWTYLQLQACQILQTDRSEHGPAPGHCTDLPGLPTKHSHSMKLSSLNPIVSRVNISNISKYGRQG